MLKQAIEYLEAGFSVIWLAEGEKRPIRKNWADLENMTADDLRASYREGMNIGVRTGKWSQVDGKYLHIVDVDIRKPDMVEKALEMFELLLERPAKDFIRVKSGSSGASFHAYLLTDRPLTKQNLWKSGEKYEESPGRWRETAEIDLLGTGQQAVLPPSIHPETGKPYTWMGLFDVDSIPEIDADLLIPYDNDDGFRVTDNDEPLGLTEDEAYSILRKHHEYTGSLDHHDTWILVGFACKHEFGGKKGWELFDRISKWGQGYDKRKNRAQWVKIKNDRAVKRTFRSIIKEARDAEMRVSQAENYELLRQFDEDEDEGLGGYTDQVEPAPSDRAELMLDFANAFEPDPIPRKQLFHELMERSDEELQELGFLAGDKDPLRNYPQKLLKVPGKLGLAVDHFNATSRKYNPQFAVIAALALGSITLGRYYSTDQRNFAALFMVACGPTGSGKEFIRTFLHDVFKAAKVEEVMGPPNFTSEAAIMAELQYKPRVGIVMDEFGRILGSVKNAGNTNAMETQTLLMSIFGALHSSHRPRRYSANGKSKVQVQAERAQLIRRPSPTIVGLTTKETLHANLTEGNVQDGFLNRLLVIESRIGVIRMRTNLKERPIPRRLIDWIRTYVLPDELQSYLDPFMAQQGEDGGGNPLGESPTDPPEPKIIPFSKGAKRRLAELDVWIVEKMRRLTDETDGLQAVYVRALEIAMRISLILAMSEENDEISAANIDWAWEYTRFHVEEVLDMASTTLGTSQELLNGDKLAAYILESGDKAQSVGHLKMRFHFLRKMDAGSLTAMFSRITSIYPITGIQTALKDGTRGSTYYIAQQYAETWRENAERKRSRKKKSDGPSYAERRRRENDD